MNRKKFIIILLLLYLLNSPITALTIKIATIVPSRTPWISALRELSREWQKITKGIVKVKIYPGGIAGNEADMVRKIRLGTINGAALTNVGITIIYPELFVLNTPFLINSNEEFNYILSKMRPRFENDILKKGFRVVIWFHAGWVKLFSKKPVIYPNDLKRIKMSYPSGTPQMIKAWQKSGFNIIPTDLKDLLMALQNRMVESFFLTPLLAGSSQFFALAPNMCDLKIAPVLGGVLIAEKSWRLIPEIYKKELVDAVEKISLSLYQKTVKLERETITAMISHGLVINKVPPKAFPAWKRVVQEGMDQLIGREFSIEIYNEIMSHLAYFRNLRP